MSDTDDDKVLAAAEKTGKQLERAWGDSGGVLEAVAIARRLQADLREAYEATDLRSRAILKLQDENAALNVWVSRMPDAGFNSDDPRWIWWHERPTILQHDDDWEVYLDTLSRTIRELQDENASLAERLRIAENRLKVTQLDAINAWNQVDNALASTSDAAIADAGKGTP